MAEITDSIKHVFEGQAQVHKELEQMKIDLLNKVSKSELET